MKHYVKHKNLFSHIKMCKEISKFGVIEIKKHKFYWHKSLIFVKDVDINNALVSNKISSGEKKL